PHNQLLLIPKIDRANHARLEQTSGVDLQSRPMEQTSRADLQSRPLKLTSGANLRHGYAVSSLMDTAYWLSE
ncbi:hypothetical protein Tco_0136669, partial [Tanacetum coccineum]